MKIIMLPLAGDVNREHDGGMEKPQLKVGDAVSLMSGGPAMTIIRIGAPTTDHCSGLVAVAWFTGGQSLRDAFPPEALVPFEDELPPTPAVEPGSDQSAVQPEPAERDDGSRGA
ncbi:MAG TPA: DUF2158 domain-containing protein [Solirubrobacter sp.]|nr:DUF2158 domain-containing protein [Solirubrobacter sp.]